MSLALVALFSGSNCAKEVQDPGEIYDAAMRQGADTVLSFNQGGVQQTCTPPLSCADPAPPCGPVQVLGPEDGQTFDLQPSTTLELGFRCSAILEVGGMGSIDFRVAAQVPSGAQLLLEVSEHGDEYETLLPVTNTNLGADLGAIQKLVVRYVRLTNQSASPVPIDAVIATRPL